MLTLDYSLSEILRFEGVMVEESEKKAKEKKGQVSTEITLDVEQNTKPQLTTTTCRAHSTNRIAKIRDEAASRTSGRKEEAIYLLDQAAQPTRASASLNDLFWVSSSRNIVESWIPSSGKRFPGTSSTLPAKT